MPKQLGVKSHSAYNLLWNGLEKKNKRARETNSKANMIKCEPLNLPSEFISTTCSILSLFNVSLTFFIIKKFKKWIQNIFWRYKTHGYYHYPLKKEYVLE